MKDILDYIIILFVFIVFLFPSKNLVTFIKSRLGKIIMLVTIVTTYYQSKVSGIILAILMYYLNNTYYENYTTTNSEYAEWINENTETQLIGFDGTEKLGAKIEYDSTTFNLKGKCPCPNNLYPTYSTCYNSLKESDKKICDDLVSLPSTSTTTTTTGTTSSNSTTTSSSTSDDTNSIDSIYTSDLADYDSLESVSTQNNNIVGNNSETKLKHGKWKHFKILFDNNNKIVKPDRFKFVNNVCDINNFNCEYIIQEESLRPQSSNTTSGSTSTGTTTTGTTSTGTTSTGTTSTGTTSTVS